MQASVDEIFEIFSNSPKAPNPDDTNSFHALKLAPRPMIASNQKASAGKSWFYENYDNSAPLWSNNGL